jgi:23S rRNA pseudouridine2605 synthase
MAEERLQKVLAKAGLGSRRACEKIILAGRVTIDNRTAQIGEKVDPDKNRIFVDEKPLKPYETNVYIALNKPPGYLSALDRRDERPTIWDLVDVPQRMFPVGRLDIQSEGLILMTNDGALANRLMHPRYQHEKEYRVLVSRRPGQEQLTRWRRGVVLDDGYHTKPASVHIESNTVNGVWLRVIMKEGQKRQIRRVGMAIGLPVNRIIRIRLGSLYLGDLRPGSWRYLKTKEVNRLSGKRDR